MPPYVGGVVPWVVPEYERALPRRRQLGAVARPQGPCVVRYRLSRRPPAAGAGDEPPAPA
jgi:hypothetical protein